MKAALAAMLALSAGAASAGADGPDRFDVAGVAPGDVLNLRAEPDPRAPVLARLAPAARGLVNRGCVELRGGARVAPAERPRGPVWCRVEFQGQIGWARARFLVESTGD